MASEDTITVRVRRRDSARLQALAKEHQPTVVEVLRSAMGALGRQDFLRGLNEDHQRLRTNPARWRQYVEELKEWGSLG